MVKGTSKNSFQSEILIPSSEPRTMSKKPGGVATELHRGLFAKSDAGAAEGAKLQLEGVFRGALKKECEQEDPFELVQMYVDVPADEGFYLEMARTFIEEYMRLGWSDEKILFLFKEPFYRGTNDILQMKGEAFVRNLIQETRHG